jgi:SAM-dependent methyltransferase
MVVPPALQPLANAIKRRLGLNVSFGYRLYNPATTGTYRRNSEFVVPHGQNIFDPAVFGIYDLASQIVVSKCETPDTQPMNLDICCKKAQRHTQKATRTPDANRYHVALRSLEPGAGVCIDACSSQPVSIVKQTVEQLGYTYQAIDIMPSLPEVQREDLQSLSFADDSIAQILSIDTLEHVPDYKRALREMYRVLVPEGSAVVHLPVYYFDKPEGVPIRSGVDPWGHTRYFSAREVIAAAVAVGFVVLRAQFCLDYGALVTVLAKPR